MFTGIVEHRGSIARLDIGSAGGTLVIYAPAIAAHLTVSASIAVNGCCLTVVHRDKENFSADLSLETLSKTSFSYLKVGTIVNLEQPLTAGKEFGGHFVLGHVDGTGRVSYLKADGDSWRFGVEIPGEMARYVVSKGSITIDGISLTVAHCDNRIAEIAIIPYTYEHTNFRDRSAGDVVNLEADVLGKYIERYLRHHGADRGPRKLSIGELVRQGF